MPTSGHRNEALGLHTNNGIVQHHTFVMMVTLHYFAVSIAEVRWDSSGSANRECFAHIMSRLRSLCMLASASNIDVAAQP